MEFFSSYPNRTLCEVLREMRDCYKTCNFGAMRGLIEEAQSIGNRMEASLGDKRDALEWAERRRKLKKQLRELKRKVPKSED